MEDCQADACSRPQSPPFRRRPRPASGRKWRDVKKPEEGAELSNAALADALKEKTEFSTEEWAAFGITALHLDHFIKSGNSYYKPFDVPEGFLPKKDVSLTARVSLHAGRGRSLRAVSPLEIEDIK